MYIDAVVNVTSSKEVPATRVRIQRFLNANYLSLTPNEPCSLSSANKKWNHTRFAKRFPLDEAESLRRESPEINCHARKSRKAVSVPIV